MSKLQMDFTLLKERLAQMEDGWSHGGFEWLDGTLVQALQAGDWLLMDNVNFCRLLSAALRIATSTRVLGFGLLSFWC